MVDWRPPGRRSTLSLHPVGAPTGRRGEKQLVSDDPLIPPNHHAGVIRQLHASDARMPRSPRRRKGNLSFPGQDPPIAAGARPARCRAATDATASELAALSALPRPVEPVVRRLSCELAAGHRDSHVAFAVAADDGDRWIWVRWSPESRGFAQIDPCSTVSADPAIEDCCLLPHAHTGPHSFEID